jgi:hypothetical protein
MRKSGCMVVLAAALALMPAGAMAQHEHSHAAPEKFGRVHFPISCKPEVQPTFTRSLALLHSFAYPTQRTLAGGLNSGSTGPAPVQVASITRVQRAPKPSRGRPRDRHTDQELPSRRPVVWPSTARVTTRSATNRPPLARQQCHMLAVHARGKDATGALPGVPLYSAPWTSGGACSWGAGPWTVD